MTREKLRTRRPLTPTVGRIYRNEAGGDFRCIDSWREEAVLQNIQSGWTFFAHGIGRYDDGTIDWDYSTGGSFMGKEEKWRT